MYCTNHPEKKSAYFDYTRNVHLCSGCVVSWFDTRRGDHHSKELGKEERRTAHVPEFNIDVSNIEFARGYHKDYDLIIGVSDVYEEVDTHWFPINEVAPWTYAPFYWFKTIVDKAVKEKKRILVHCHAGAHRSKMMVYCWLFYKGWTDEKIQERLHMARQFEYDVEKGYIPADVFDMMEIMDEHPSWSLAGCLREMGKKQLLSNGALR